MTTITRIFEIADELDANLIQKKQYLISNDLQPVNNLQKNSSFRGCPSGQNPESRKFIGSNLDSGFRRGGPGMTG